MIGFLQGVVALRDDPYILVNVQGVGYRVLVSSSVLSQTQVGKPLTIYTYTHVREDALELYGFSAPKDLKLFELLISVSGVGPKTALGVFSLGGSQEIIEAIATNDTSFFSSVPRLGTKNAQKIIIELKNKVGGGIEFDIGKDGMGKTSEIIAVLKSFGFSQKESHEALRGIKEQGVTTEERIKLALKYLGK